MISFHSKQKSITNYHSHCFRSSCLLLAGSTFSFRFAFFVFFWSTRLVLLSLYTLSAIPLSFNSLCLLSFYIERRLESLFLSFFLSYLSTLFSKYKSVVFSSLFVEIWFIRLHPGMIETSTLEICVILNRIFDMICNLNCSSSSLRCRKSLVEDWAWRRSTVHVQ